MPPPRAGVDRAAWVDHGAGAGRAPGGSAGGASGALRVFFTTTVAAEPADVALLAVALPWYLGRLRIGGDRCMVTVHAPGGGAAHYARAVSILEAAGVRGHVRWTSAYSGPAKERVRSSVLLPRFRLEAGDWIVHADSDEFAVIDSDTIFRARAAGSNALRGEWTDRVALHGALPEIVENSTAGATVELFAAFPLACALRRKQKVVAYEFPLRANDGAHGLVQGDEDRAKYAAGPPLTVWHLKWHAHVFDRLRERVAVKQRLGKVAAAAVTEKILAHLGTHGGVCVDCEALRGVCCAAPCDVGALRRYPEFFETAKPRLWTDRGAAAVVLLVVAAVAARRAAHRRRSA
ncbi:hypothetical protein M885DRAFT_504462 [Pelagophyceae sp. CCMP2097]|nr:hypothetical protein M885DRAFT_504462 [Pelagophyceae sp. CCMP2097]